MQVNTYPSNVEHIVGLESREQVVVGPSAGCVCVCVCVGGGGRSCLIRVYRATILTLESFVSHLLKHGKCSAISVELEAKKTQH